MSWLQEDGLIRLSRRSAPGGKPRKPRKSRKPRKPVVRVNVNARARVRKHPGGRARVLRVSTLALGPLAILAGVFLLWLGIREGAQRLYARHDRFTIRRMEVRAASPTTRALARDYTRLTEGMNLFAFNLDQVRTEVLDHAPSFKSMRLTRYLPDTLIIEVVERTPLARIGRKGNFVADRDGFVFVIRSGASALPAIVSFREATPGPGTRLQGHARAALQVVEVCENPAFGMRINSIDVSQSEHLVVRLVYAARVREVKLSWQGMDRLDKGARKELELQLGRVKQSFDARLGRMRTRLDATMGSRIIGAEE